ncbi:MAG TPA: discoidin domain-containing protein, partial [Armatimonadota bacterium]
MTQIRCIVMLLALCLATAAAFAADPPPNKVGSAAVTVTQFAPDGKAVGKVTELTDGNPLSRWLCRQDQSPAPLTPIRLSFDLGVERTVVKLRLANYFTGQNFDRGCKTMDVFVGMVPLPAPDAKPLVAETPLKISDANGPAWTEILLPKPVKARYLTLRITANWGAAGRYAANEVEIYTVEPDPPATAKPGADVPPYGLLTVTQYDTGGTA